jgi:hypothetical protein
MSQNVTVKRFSLSVLSLLLLASLGWAQDFCGDGMMLAVLDTIPPCSPDSGHPGTQEDHYGDIFIALIDCGTGDTVGIIERAIHILPYCPQPPSGGGSFPSGGVDTLNGTTGEIILSLITPPVTETLIVRGDMRILRSDPDSLRHIDTEILSMELTGTSPTLGPVRVRAGSDYGFEITPKTGTEEDEKEFLKTRDIILHQAIPNPLTDRATIRFGLIESGWVNLKVYNLRGESVRTLIDNYQTAGLHKEVWDLKDNEGKEVSSGIYFYRLTALGKSEEDDPASLKEDDIPRVGVKNIKKSPLVEITRGLCY